MPARPPGKMEWHQAQTADDAKLFNMVSDYKKTQSAFEAGTGGKWAITTYLERVRCTTMVDI
eukprot:15472365-Alexandrium_andersonii.AAC.1